MKVGVSLFAQNYVDWDRFEAAEANAPAGALPQLVPDAQIYREQFQLGRLVPVPVDVVLGEQRNSDLHGRASGLCPSRRA